MAVLVLTRRDLSDLAAMWSFSLLLLALLLLSLDAFHHVRTPLFRPKHLSSLRMASSPLPSWLPVPGLPKELAMEISPAASSDPTAGMTPEQIASYTSRIGGESSDVFHQAVGVLINLSLIAFAVLGALYSTRLLSSSPSSSTRLLLIVVCLSCALAGQVRAGQSDSRRTESLLEANGAEREKVFFCYSLCPSLYLTVGHCVSGVAQLCWRLHCGKRSSRSASWA